MKPTDQAIFGMASKSPGRNTVNPVVASKKYCSEGRALWFGVKAA
jgi:hypothetical protein